MTEVTDFFVRLSANFSYKTTTTIFIHLLSSVILTRRMFELVNWERHYG